MNIEQFEKLKVRIKGDKTLYTVISMAVDDYVGTEEAEEFDWDMIDEFILPITPPKTVIEPKQQPLMPYKSNDEYLKFWKDELGIQAMEFLIERGTVKRYKQGESHRDDYEFSEYGLEELIKDCIVKFTRFKSETK